MDFFLCFLDSYRPDLSVDWASGLSRYGASWILALVYMRVGGQSPGCAVRSCSIR